jgi:hypothetical protein
MHDLVSAGRPANVGEGSKLRLSSSTVLAATSAVKRLQRSFRSLEFAAQPEALH